MASRSEGQSGLAKWDQDQRSAARSLLSTGSRHLAAHRARMSVSVVKASQMTKDMEERAIDLAKRGLEETDSEEVRRLQPPSSPRDPAPPPRSCAPTSRRSLRKSMATCACRAANRRPRAAPCAR